LQLLEKDETLQSLQTAKNNVETTTEKNIVVVEVPKSPICSSTIAASPTVCEKNDDTVEFPSSPIYSSPPVAICKPYVVNLCFKNNDYVVSPKFGKHTTGIGSLFLIKMAYTKRGIGKNGQGIVALVIPEMKSPRRCIGYDVVVSSFPTPSLAANKEVLFVAGGVQSNFPVDQSPELIDEMVVPKIYEY
jgi:hypothetical protein